MSRDRSCLQSRLGSGVVALWTVALASVPAWAEDYPPGPVQIIVGYAAGGGTDTLARLIAPSLSAELGQPVVVHNLPGGGGLVAAATVLRDGADGTAILATNQPDMFLGTLVEGSDLQRDDMQVAMVDLKDPRVMLVPKDGEIDSFRGFVERAKAEPGKLTVSVAQGSAQELFAKWLFGELGLDVRLVGYSGGAAAANAILAGDVVATIGDDFARMNIRDQAKALFVGSATKSPRWPEAPVLADELKALDVTLPSPDFLARYGVYAVSAEFKAAHPAAYEELQQAVLKARQAAEFQGYLDKNGLQDLSVGKPGEELEAVFERDFDEIESIGR